MFLRLLLLRGCGLCIRNGRCDGLNHGAFRFLGGSLAYSALFEPSPQVGWVVPDRAPCPWAESYVGRARSSGAPPSEACLRNPDGGRDLIFSPQAVAGSSPAVLAVRGL